MRKVERDNSWKAENLSGKPTVENLKIPQISAIIYIQGERKVTHQIIQKLIGLRPTARKRYYMTKREFFVAVSEGKMTEEMQAMAAEFLVKMDAQLAARKGKVSEKEQAKRDEREALARKVATEILGAEAMTATDVAAKLTEMLGEEVKVQKASSLCRKAVELGLAVQTDVKIPKKGAQKAYTAIVE